MSDASRHLGGKRPRPKLCQACHAPAVWADLTYIPAVIIRADWIKHFEQPTLRYWCASCAEQNPIGEQ